MIAISLYLVRIIIMLFQLKYSFVYTNVVFIFEEILQIQMHKTVSQTTATECYV